MTIFKVGHIGVVAGFSRYWDDTKFEVLVILPSGRIRGRIIYKLPNRANIPSVGNTHDFNSKNCKHVFPKSGDIVEVTGSLKAYNGVQCKVVNDIERYEDVVDGNVIFVGDSHLKMDRRVGFYYNAIRIVGHSDSAIVSRKIFAEKGWGPS